MPTEFEVRRAQFLLRLKALVDEFEVGLAIQWHNEIEFYELKEPFPTYLGMSINETLSEAIIRAQGE